MGSSVFTVQYIGISSVMVYALNETITSGPPRAVAKSFEPKVLAFTSCPIGTLGGAKLFDFDNVLSKYG